MGLIKINVYGYNRNSIETSFQNNYKTKKVNPYMIDYKYKNKIFELLPMS